MLYIFKMCQCGDGSVIFLEMSQVCGYSDLRTVLLTNQIA